MLHTHSTLSAAARTEVAELEAAAADGSHTQQGRLRAEGSRRGAALQTCPLQGLLLLGLCKQIMQLV